MACLGAQALMATTLAAALTPAARQKVAAAAKAAGSAVASVASAAAPELTRYTITLNRTLAYVPGDTKPLYTNYDFSIVGAP